MNNAERIMQHIAKHGSKNILIHTIPGTSNWLVCEKISQDLWKITLCNPQKTSSYNLGIITEEAHKNLWKELITAEINYKVNKIKATRER